MPSTAKLNINNKNLKMQNYIRLLSYENAEKVIEFVESLKNYDDYACITSGGVSLKSTEENHSKILVFLKSLKVRFELTEKHPEVVNKEIVDKLKSVVVIHKL